MRKSSPPASTGIAPTDCAPSTSIGTPVCSRSSCTGRTRPLVQSTCEIASSRVRGVDRGEDRVRVGRRRPRRARRSRAPARSGRSARRSWSRSRPPARGRGRRGRCCSRRVVEPVSAICSGSAPTSAASAARSSLAQLEHPLEVLLAEAAVVEIRVELLLHALRRSGGRAGRTCPAFRYASCSSTGKSARASSGVTRSSSRRGRGRTAPRHCAGAAPPATPRARRGRCRATRMWSMFGPGRSGSRRLKSPARTRASPAAASDSMSSCARPQLGARHLGPLELVRGVHVPDHEPVEPDGVADTALAAGLADPNRPALERLERRREQDRVRLARDAGAEPLLARGAGGRRRASAARAALRDRRRDRHAAPVVEPRERPERHLLEAERRRARRARSARPSLGAARAAPAARCGRGRRSSCGSARHPPTALAYERVRVVVADPPAFTPPYDHALAAALAARGRGGRAVTSRFRFGAVAAPDGYRRRELFYPLSSRLFGRSRAARCR